MLTALLRNAPAAARHAQSIGALCAAIYPGNDPSARGRRWLLAASIWRHWPVHQSLTAFFEQPLLHDLAVDNPKLLRKIYHPYPCTGLSVPQRAAWLTTHLRLARELLGDPLLRKVELQPDFVLCDIALPNGHGLLPLQLTRSRRFEKEGDLSLVLLDPFGTALFSLTFSFEQLAEGPGLLIGAIHGTLPREVAKHLTKLSIGLRPQNLLLFLLQVLASEWGLRRINAVSRGRHVYSGTRQHRQVMFDYDGFWKSLGGTERPGGLFTLPLSPTRRQVEDMPGNKRAMYQRRYAWMDELAQATVQRLRAARGQPSIPAVHPPSPLSTDRG